MVLTVEATETEESRERRINSRLEDFIEGKVEELYNVCCQK